MRILRRTTYEDFEIDDDKLRAAMEDWVPKYANLDDDPDILLIEWFELHNGSTYCDEIIGEVNFDVGYEILERLDD